jgi:hypothetical protein
VSLNQDLDADYPWECKLPGQEVLVFQGGGALGSYQAGVYQALYEADVEPDWIIGTSIGAINACWSRAIGATIEFRSSGSSGSGLNRIPHGILAASPPAFPTLSRIGQPWSAVSLRSSNQTF